MFLKRLIKTKERLEAEMFVIPSIKTTLVIYSTVSITCSHPNSQIMMIIVYLNGI